MTDDDLVLEEPCPLCKAEPGQACRSIGRWPSSMVARPIGFLHLERIQAYYRALR